MIRLWLIFFIIAILIHFGLSGWRSLTGKEKWTLTKSIGYSIIIALLAVLAMSLIVIIF